MDNDRKVRLLDRVRKATARGVLRMKCPICHGSLSIQFTSRGKGALSVMCPACVWRIIADGVRQEPPWVRDLGTKIETRVKQLSPQASSD
jgi:hypothetical protein